MKKLNLKSTTDTQSPASTVGATLVAPTVGGRLRPGFRTPEPEVLENKPRRKFTAKYKLSILKQADDCQESGQIGVLLRNQGLYSSNLTIWRKQREQGLLDAMSPKKRGRKTELENPLADRVAQLEKENRVLSEKLRKAEIIIDVQKKISQILEINQNQDESERSRS